MGAGIGAKAWSSEEREAEGKDADTLLVLKYQHDFTEEGGQLRCASCRRYAFTEATKAQLRSSPCDKWESRLDIAGGAMGHILRVTDSRLYFCSVCGAYGDSSLKGLVKPCLGRGARAKTALDAIEKGIHPRTGLCVLGTSRWVKDVSESVDAGALLARRGEALTVWPSETGREFVPVGVGAASCCSVRQ